MRHLLQKNIITGLLLLSQITFLLNQTAQAQDTRQLTREKPVALVQKRVALVIGNSQYIHTKSLKNPVNDAEDISKNLRTLGFEVISGTNQDKRGMQSLIREFGTKLIQQNGVGLFFYAGHGLQFQGQNYLVPIDAEIFAEDEIDDESININLLLGKIAAAENGLNIIVLDACRDNPFAEKWSSYRSTAENVGLAKVTPPSGTILLYATQPGNVASDGEGRNGLFTQSFLERIKEPNVELDRLIKLVVGDVVEKSNKQQVPWREGVTLGDFYFVKDEIKSVEITVSQNKATLPNTGNLVPTISPREENAWKLVRNSADTADFNYFLEEFPNGYYSNQARRQIEQFGWNAIENSNDKKKVQAYLEKYPEGLNSSAARIKLRQLEPRENSTTVVTSPPTVIEKPITENKTTVAENKTTVADPVVIPEPIKEETVAETRKLPIEEPFALKVAPPKTISKNKVSAATAKKAVGKLQKIENRTNPHGIELVFIPAGNFIMGASAGNITESNRMARKDYSDMEPDWIKSELPARRVEIPEDFWMGKTEITQTQWQNVMENNPSFYKDCGDCPVERVSWEDAKEFIKKLNEAADGFIYSLPSEAEWEYAARGGTNKLFAGNVEEMAWHSGNSEGRTQTAGTKSPNTFGLFDLHGNVAEWCEDAYKPSYKESPVAEPSAEVAVVYNLNQRVVRGGSWNVFPTLQRATARMGLSPAVRNIVTGFRLAARPKQ